MPRHLLLGIGIAAVILSALLIALQLGSQEAPTPREIAVYLLLGLFGLASMYSDLKEVYADLGEAWRRWRRAARQPSLTTIAPFPSSAMCSSATVTRTMTGSGIR